MLAQKEAGEINSFWSRVGMAAKRATGFNIQVVCDLARLVRKSRTRHLDSVTVRFYMERNCWTFRTKGFFFVNFGLYPGTRIAVPLRKNTCLDRYFGLLGSGWHCTTYGLTPALEIIAYLRKDPVSSLFSGCNMLGVDVNLKRIAVSVVSPQGDMIYQTYFGQQIWGARKRLMNRRSVLQTVGNRKKLRIPAKKEANFVRTNIGQVVKEIMRLAMRFNADIAIERLRRFQPKGRAFNRAVLRIPFRSLRNILEARCFDNRVALHLVSPWHTSKWCTRCGAAGPGHSHNYSIYKCRVCGLTMNADRKASVAIAAKALLERSGSLSQTIQISGRRVPVTALIGSPNEIIGRRTVSCGPMVDGSSQIHS
jgi:IS605 OrfB family transposase